MIQRCRRLYGLSSHPHNALQQCPVATLLCIIECRNCIRNIFGRLTGAHSPHDEVMKTLCTAGHSTEMLIGKLHLRWRNFAASTMVGDDDFFTCPARCHALSIGRRVAEMRVADGAAVDSARCHVCRRQCTDVTLHYLLPHSRPQAPAASRTTTFQQYGTIDNVLALSTFGRQLS